MYLSRTATNLYFYIYDNYNSTVAYTLAGITAAIHPTDSLIPVVIAKKRSRRYLWTFDVRYNGVNVPQTVGGDCFWPYLGDDLYIGSQLGTSAEAASAIHSIEVYDEALDPRLLC